MNKESELFLIIKLEFALKILASKETGVRKRKKSIVKMILGIIWLRIEESLNHIFSISKAALFEKTATAEITRIDI